MNEAGLKMEELLKQVETLTDDKKSLEVRLYNSSYYIFLWNICLRPKIKSYQDWTIPKLDNIYLQKFVISSPYGCLVFKRKWKYQIPILTHLLNLGSITEFSHSFKDLAYRPNYKFYRPMAK